MLVRNGEDYRHGRHRETGEQQHCFELVYSEMLLQICAHYHALPDPRTLTSSQIRWFYDGMRTALKEATKPRPEPKK